MGLCGSHLCHQVVRVDREVLLLRLGRVKQVGVQRVAERGRVDRLGLTQVVPCEEVVEVLWARIGDVEAVGVRLLPCGPKCGVLCCDKAGFDWRKVWSESTCCCCCGKDCGWRVDRYCAGLSCALLTAKLEGSLSSCD